MKKSFSLGSLIILVAVSVTAQDYVIKMQQPLKIGQRYKFTVVASQSSENSLTAEQQSLKNQKEELSVEMESEVTVLAVDAKGRSTKESHTIVKLLQGAGKQPMLVAGTKVIASRPSRKTMFEIAGEPAADAVAKALDLAITITSGGATDDEIFGTTERKKVGDQWPMNEALAVRDANEKMANAILSITSVKGSTTLQKITKDGDSDVLHLGANMTATLAPAPKSPFTNMNSTLTATFTGAFPVDVTKCVREEGETMNMIIQASGKPNPQGPEMQLSGKAKRSINRQYKFLN